jgi:hypothetical protein
VVSVSTKLVADARALWASVSRSEADVDEWERTEIQPWVEAHPLTDLSFARTSGILKFAEVIRERGGAVQTLMTTQEQLEILSEEARIYLANAHKQVRGETELVLGDLIPPDQRESLVTGVKLLGASADRAATFLEQTPALIAAERREVLGAIDRQRQLLMDDVRRERAEVGAMIAAEREIILRSVTEQRIEFMKAISSEHAAALKEFGSERAAILLAVNEQRLETLSWLGSKVHRETEELVDRLMLRLVILIVVGVVATPIIAHIYFRLWPRSIRGS